MYSDIVFRKLSKMVVLKKLKSYNHPSETKNLIINIVLVQKEELEEIDIQESEYKYPSFIIRQRNNFSSYSFMGSPMHLIGLGLVSIIISIIHQLASLFDVKKDLSTSIKSRMERLVNSRIYFVPIETLISDKTIG